MWYRDNRRRARLNDHVEATVDGKKILGIVVHVRDERGFNDVRIQPSPTGKGKEMPAMITVDGQHCVHVDDLSKPK